MTAHLYLAWYTTLQYMSSLSWLHDTSIHELSWLGYTLIQATFLAWYIHFNTWPLYLAWKVTVPVLKVTIPSQESDCTNVLKCIYQARKVTVMYWSVYTKPGKWLYLAWKYIYQYMKVTVQARKYVLQARKVTVMYWSDIYQARKVTFLAWKYIHQARKVTVPGLKVYIPSQESDGSCRKVYIPSQESDCQVGSVYTKPGKWAVM